MIDSALARFMKEASRFPILTREREYELATVWRARRDRAARDELVGCHLRLVVKIARGFSGYDLPLSDLVAEGNLGLMKAAEKFEPERGVRFASYAIWWIRAAIQQYVLYSWSLVKIGTTAAQKKLFFNLRRLKAKLRQSDSGDLAPDAVTAIAKALDVPEGDVVEMNRRLSGADASLNVVVGAGEDSEWVELLSDDRPSQETTLGDLEEGRWYRTLVRAALEELNPRERDIVVEHRLKEQPASLEELSRRYAVSPERIRQIEMRAISKMASSLARFPGAQPQTAEIFAL
jgi:RNA polymerase sigma-32 factor